MLTLAQDGVTRGVTAAGLRSLYLCYFGIDQPLVHSQVLPYLRELIRAGVCVHLLTFDPPIMTSAQREAQRARLLADGIVWHSLHYHTSVPGTLYDILAGTMVAVRISLRKKVRVLHARSHVPLVMALLARVVSRNRVIFDMRGLMAEEYVDGDVWQKDSAIVGVVKKVERYGLRVADETVVLTNRLQDWLLARGLVKPERLEVIPCCTDVAAYPPIPEWADPPWGQESRFELIYAGSVTGLYQLEEMARFFLAARSVLRSAHFRVLTTSAPLETAERLKALGVADGDFSVASASLPEVRERLVLAHAGISFRRPTPAQMAASPTKIAEYLAAGLPVISNEGIGDTDRILRQDRVGVVVRGYDPGDISRAVGSLGQLLREPGLRARCRESALRRFGLREVGAVRYLRLYERLAGAINQPSGQVRRGDPS